MCFYSIIHSTNSDRAVLLREGVIKCIVGLLRCSRSIDVLTVAVSCLDLAVFGCEEICYEIAQMGLVKVILTLLKLIKEGKVNFMRLNNYSAKTMSQHYSIQKGHVLVCNVRFRCR